MGTLVFGIDIGGTRTKMGLVQLPEGEVLASCVYPTEARDEAAFWRRLTEGMDALATEAQVPRENVAGIGVGIGSFVYTEGGVVDSMCGFIDFLDGVPLGTRLTEGTGLPCVVDNDVRAVALAECLYGAGRGAKRVLTLTLGTGVGVCMLVDGEFTDTEAVHHLAGHLQVRGDGEWINALDAEGCYCVVPGCLESSCSGAALERLAGEWVQPGIDNIALMRLALKGDARAQRCLETYFTWLARGLNQLVYVFGPDMIVLGGGLAKDFGPYLEKLNAALTARVHSRQQPRIVLSQLWENSGVLGAALLCQRAAQEL